MSSLLKKVFKMYLQLQQHREKYKQASITSTTIAITIKNCFHLSVAPSGNEFVDSIPIEIKADNRSRAILRLNSPPSNTNKKSTLLINS
jgi:hypothetical protein